MAKVYKDLRSFLATLEKEGQLVRIKDEVMPEPDIASAGRAAANIKTDRQYCLRKSKDIKEGLSRMYMVRGLITR